MRQALNICLSVLVSPLNQKDRVSSSFRHSPILATFCNISKVFGTVQPDTLKVDWFNCARISRKQAKSCHINRSTPRTDRWSIDLSLLAAKGQPSIHRYGRYHEERAVAMRKIK